ncbi:MAG: class I SAM-dependent methyltransferase [Capsulimonadaceae bacterium]
MNSNSNVSISDNTAAAAVINYERRDCPVCGSSDDSKVYVESKVDPAKLDAFAFASRKLPEYMHHRMVRCPSCDLVYASPVPRIEGLAEAYEQADFDSAVESRYAAQTAAGILKGFVDHLPDKVGALDIGCGDGAFLAELVALGFTDIVGVEPSTAPIAAAPDHVRGWIRQELFDPANHKPNSLSLVTCFQVIEHVPDPLALTRAAFSLLKPGGAFFMISHNRDAVTARVLGTKSPIFDIEHLQLFSLPTMTDMFRRAGFVEIGGGGIFNRYPVHYYCKLMPLPSGMKLPLLRSLQRSAFGRTALPAALGNLRVVGYRPR